MTVNKRFRKSTFVWGLFTTLVILIIFKILLNYIGGENHGLVRAGAFAINPDTILVEIAQGKQDVFSSTLSTPEPLPLGTDQPVHWSQANYFVIAQSLHEFVWTEPIDNWHLDSIIFSTDCVNIKDGFQSAELSFWKTNLTIQGARRVEHKISITPLYNVVEWSEINYQPALAKWPSVDISQINFSAYDALQIAELNGGQRIRSTFNNECTILNVLAPKAQDSPFIWNISYIGLRDSHLLELNIDAISGELK